MIRIKRVYDPREPGDGRRFLVDRLWPRGIKKESLQLDGWLKDVAPSDSLRRGFCHVPERWKEFERRYTAELRSRADVLRRIEEAARLGDVTLLYSARDTEHNNAVVLQRYLMRRVSR